MPFIGLLVEETGNINERINNEPGLGENKVSRSNLEPGGEGLNLKGLLDIPTTPEEDEAFRQLVERREREYREKKQKSLLVQ